MTIRRTGVYGAALTLAALVSAGVVLAAWSAFGPCLRDQVRRRDAQIQQLNREMSLVNANAASLMPSDSVGNIGSDSSTSSIVW